MKRIVTLAAIAATALPAFVPAEAQRRGAGNAVAQQQQRIRQVVVYGREPCPRGRGDEIVICARRPSSERYRIPREVRDRTPLPGDASTSWAARARSLETVGRTGTQSCSTVGPGGFTGCWEQMMNAHRAAQEDDEER